MFISCVRARLKTRQSSIPPTPHQFASTFNKNIGACFNQDGTGTDGSFSGGTSWMQNSQGGGVHHGVGEQFVESHSGEGFYTYEEGLTCTDKCRGIHGWWDSGFWHPAVGSPTWRMTGRVGDMCPPL